MQEPDSDTYVSNGGINRSEIGGSKWTIQKLLAPFPAEVVGIKDIATEIRASAELPHWLNENSLRLHLSAAFGSIAPVTPSSAFFTADGRPRSKLGQQGATLARRGRSSYPRGP